MDIVQEIKKFVEEECKKPTNKYGYDAFLYHFVPMVKYAEKLADELGGDKEVILIASWLHDIGSIVYGRENHHITGGKIAEEKLKKLGKKERRDYAHTTKELLDLINEYKKYYKGTKVKTLVTIEAHDGQVAMARKQMFPKQKREKKQVIADKYYVVKDITQGNYVIKKTRELFFRE